MARRKKDQSEISRRQILKLGAGAVIVAPLSTIDAVQKKAGPAKASSVKAGFFTREARAMVDELSEMIIPADDHSPGARAAGVVDYIDQRLVEAFEEDTRTRWRDGLKLVDQLSSQMNGKPFMKASADERLAVLTRMSQNEGEPKTPEERFFRELKARTARGYYTSKIGILTEMEYKGNTYLKEFAGEDAK
jgi:hypothetical protein